METEMMTLVTIGKYTFDATIIKWNFQNNDYYLDTLNGKKLKIKGKEKIDGSVMLFLENKDDLVNAFEEGYYLGIKFGNNDYSAVATAINLKDELIILDFDHAVVISKSKDPVTPNHNENKMVSMSEEELKDCFGDKYEEINKKIELLSNKKKMPMTIPAYDLYMLFCGKCPFALFDSQFLSAQDEAIVLFNRCLRQGHIIRSWKMDNGRTMMGIGNMDALCEIGRMIHDREKLIKHIEIMLNIESNEKMGEIYNGNSLNWRA